MYVVFPDKNELNDQISKEAFSSLIVASETVANCHVYIPVSL